jgi:hypothetical protein
MVGDKTKVWGRILRSLERVTSTYLIVQTLFIFDIGILSSIFKIYLRLSKFTDYSTNIYKKACGTPQAFLR